MVKYCHVTSPIRRLVDVVNLCLLQKQLRIGSFSEETYEKCGFIIENLDTINQDFQNSKRFQHRCQWIDVCSKTCPFRKSGIVIEKVKNIEKNNWKYTIFFPSFHLFKSYHTSNETFQVGQEYRVEFLFFPNEALWSKKIRVQLMDESRREYDCNHDYNEQSK